MYLCLFKRYSVGQQTKKGVLMWMNRSVSVWNEEQGVSAPNKENNV